MASVHGEQVDQSVQTSAPADHTESENDYSESYSDDEESNQDNTSSDESTDDTDDDAVDDDDESYYSSSSESESRKSSSDDSSSLSSLSENEDRKEKTIIIQTTPPDIKRKTVKSVNIQTTPRAQIDVETETELLLLSIEDQVVRSNIQKDSNKYRKMTKSEGKEDQYNKQKERDVTDKRAEPPIKVNQASAYSPSRPTSFSRTSGRSSQGSPFPELPNRSSVPNPPGRKRPFRKSLNYSSNIQLSNNHKRLPKSSKGKPRTRFKPVHDNSFMRKMRKKPKSNSGKHGKGISLAQWLYGIR